MKRFIVIERSREADDYGDGERYELLTPKNSIYVGQMEPEDASLGRDLNFVYSITDMIKEAYEAGKDGEELVFEFEEVEE